MQQAVQDEGHGHKLIIMPFDLELLVRTMTICKHQEVSIFLADIYGASLKESYDKNKLETFLLNTNIIFYMH